ncbi:endocuticle structural glycoprotein ABD-5-like [Chrysoperla carnea]|uniref:endocuticle structural glycoprotein ABD-5-like n=1 Tax=Chrysoperla carnea TaxID=189513 RepID=UPI001D07259D|nr:endocuticle structural glycoprotein ABD-5-like [Chrysoperla carnea]
MKLVIAFTVACVAVALARPQGPQDKDAVIVQQRSDNGLTKYDFGYETSNGISQEEQGEVKEISPEEGLLRVVGKYSYTGPDGVLYTVTYIADENGFQPQGDHLPKAP